MVQNIAAVAGQVGTLFLMMAVGFLLGKLGKLNSHGLSQMTFLLLYIVNPCIIIQCFQVEATPALLRELGTGALVTLACYAAYILIAQLLFRRTARDDRDSLRFAVVYGNIGFMGVPLVQSVLGADAMIYGALSLVAFNLFSWTHGVILMGGRKALSPRKVFLNPGVIGLAIALVFFLGHFTLPAPIGNAVSFLADLNSPLAMVAVGAQMASAGLLRSFRRPVLYAASAVRLVVIPALTALCLLPLGLNPALYCASVILSAAPVAGITSMFAQQFGRNTETAVQMITLSTLLSIVTLPVFAALAKSLSGF